MRESLPLPERIANAPELQMGLSLFFEAFFDLHTTRTVGLEQGPIPWPAVEEYAQRLGLDEGQREELHVYVRAMDNAYLEWSRAKAEGSRGQSSAVRAPHAPARRPR